MDIKLNKNSKTPLYQQIESGIQELIIKGELHQGFKLPSERKLADELKVNRNTVIKAYKELVFDGFLCVSSSKPKGYVVGNLDDEDVPARHFYPLKKMLKYNLARKERQFLELYAESEKEDLISFGGLIIGHEAFPSEEINEIAGSIMQAVLSDENLRLKRNISSLLSADNMYINPRNIQLVTETNQALDDIATLYMEKGDYILAEDPISPDNLFLMRNHGINVVTVPLEDDGMDIAALEYMVKRYKPKFIYTIPNFHNPTGTVTSLNKRKAILEITSSANIPIIEEDSMRDIRFTESKIPSLYTLDKMNRVIYIDSFSLIFPYGIKTGYVIGPKEPIEALEHLIVSRETTVSNISQYILNEFIERGYYSRHSERIAEYYKKKRDLMCEALDEIRDKGIEYKKPEGGLLIWCTLSPAINEQRLFYECKKNGILIMPGYIYYPNINEGKSHIRLSYSNATDDEIISGIKILGETLAKCIERR